MDRHSQRKSEHVDISMAETLLPTTQGDAEFRVRRAYTSMIGGGPSCTLDARRHWTDHL